VTLKGGGLRKRDYKTLSIRFSPEVREIVEQAAQDDNRSAASLVELATMALLKERGYLPKQ
jgi:hypothetical protein